MMCYELLEEFSFVRSRRCTCYSEFFFPPVLSYLDVIFTKAVLTVYKSIGVPSRLRGKGYAMFTFYTPITASHHLFVIFLFYFKGIMSNQHIQHPFSPPPLLECQHWEWSTPRTLRD
jgi:hypothetical protein